MTVRTPSDLIEATIELIDFRWVDAPKFLHHRCSIRCDASRVDPSNEPEASRCQREALSGNRAPQRLAAVRARTKRDRHIQNARPVDKLISSEAPV
jgi:hypothetical protein